MPPPRRANGRRRRREIRAGVDEVERRIVGRDLQLSGVLRLHRLCGHALPVAGAAGGLSAPASGHRGWVSENSGWWTCRRHGRCGPCEWRASAAQHLVGRQLGRMTMRVYAQRRGALAAKHPAHRAPVPRLPPGLPSTRTAAAASTTAGCTRTSRPAGGDAHRPAAPRGGHGHTGLALALLPTFIEATEPDLVPVSEPLREVSTPVGC